MADVFPPVEPLVVAYLTEQFDAVGEDATVGVGVPPGWTATSTPHVQVVSDGTPRMTFPIAAHVTIRIVVRAARTTEAQRLCSLAQGLLADHPGSGRVGAQIARVRALTGVMPTRDTETRAELAWATCQVTVRSERIEVTGS